MDIALLLIVVGLILAVFVSPALGALCIIVGLLLVVWPNVRA